MVSQTTGSSMCSSITKLRVRVWDGSRLGWYTERMSSRAWLSSMLKGQLIKACWRSSTTPSSQCLQIGEVFGVILWTRLSVGRSWWRSLQRNEVWSGVRPLSLASLQVLSQSRFGVRASALLVINFLGVPLSIVTLSSSR